jgi:flagellar protein FlbD
MIRLTKLNGRPIVVNSENIEFIEATPDTTVCFTNGHRLVVRDTVDDVIGKVLECRRRTHEVRPPDNAESSTAGPPDATGLGHDETR